MRTVGSRSAAPPIHSALLMGAALIGAVGSGQLIPWTLGIANPALDAGLNATAALVAFLSSLTLARALTAGAHSRSRSRAVLDLVAVYLVLAATLTVAVSASTRLPSVMEIDEQLPRALGALAAFVTVLVAVQWAVLYAWRDVARASAQLRVRLPVPAPVMPDPALPAPVPLSGGVAVAARAELMQKQPGTAI